MAITTDVLKGTDTETSTIVFKDDVGNSIPLSMVNDYQAYVYYMNGLKKVNLFTFRKNVLGNDKPLVPVDAYTVSFVVDRTQTLKAPCGLLYVEIVAEFPSTTEYILSKKKAGRDGFVLCNIVESANPQSML